MAMTAEEFRKTIAAFGMSQAGVARFLGISARSISDDATGRSQIPEPTEIIFALMRYSDVSPADARRIAGLPAENYGDRRRNRVYVGRKRKFIGAAIKIRHGGRRTAPLLQVAKKESRSSPGRRPRQSRQKRVGDSSV